MGGVRPGWRSSSMQRWRGHGGPHRADPGQSSKRSIRNTGRCLLDARASGLQVKRESAALEALHLATKGDASEMRTLDYGKECELLSSCARILVYRVYYLLRFKPSHSHAHRIHLIVPGVPVLMPNCMEETRLSPFSNRRSNRKRPNSHTT